MNAKCKKCQWGIIELNLSEEQKLEILGLINQDLKMFAIKKLYQELNISLKDAKGIVLHLNKDFGKCIRCNFDELSEENIECPKCKAFSYNLKVDVPFNMEFCSILEHSLNFEELEDEGVKGFWCDGIDHMPRDMKSLSRANLEENKLIKTKAWIGKDGQGEYEMTINLGGQSIENYQLNRSLVNCIPDNNFKEWVIIEPEKKEIQVFLK
ncbi:MAG: hypothetical protein AB8B69_26950 [Chitinophagales bacterium]